MSIGLLKFARKALIRVIHDTGRLSFTTEQLTREFLSEFHYFLHVRFVFLPTACLLPALQAIAYVKLQVPVTIHFFYTLWRRSAFERHFYGETSLAA